MKLTFAPMDTQTMFVTAVVVCFLCQLLNTHVSGVTLSPCGDSSDKTAEVKQGKTDTFTCSELADGLRVDWTVVYRSKDYEVGYCPADGGDCKRGKFSSAFTPSRVSGTESKLVVNSTALTDKTYFQQGTLKCEDGVNMDSCQMDYIVPAKGSCNIRTGTGSLQFRLNGSCSLQSGAKSSRNRFKCVWNRQGGTSWKFTVPLTENTYQTGCTVTGQPLPTVSGQYTYTVTLFPGRQTVDAAGTVDITRPSVPTVTGCGGDNFIPENTTVRCTCTTDTIGQPTGRLRWFKIGDNSMNKVGNYGDKSLTVSPTLLLSDHQSSVFECFIQWTEDIHGTPITFNVGRSPRGPDDIGQMTFISDPVAVTFDVTAFPTPDPLTFRYLGPSEADTGTSEVSDQIQLTGVCQPKAGDVYQSTCTVTLTSVTMETAAGFYHVIVTNPLGSGHFRFRVLYKDTEDEAPSHLGLAIGLAVSLAVVVVVIIIVVIWLWRRQWTLPCADSPKPIDTSDPVISSDPTGSSFRSVASSHYYLTPIPEPAEQTGPYDSLHMDDVGLRSEYTEITSPGNPAAPKVTAPSESLREGKLYENTDSMHD